MKETGMKRKTDGGEARRGEREHTKEEVKDK